MIAFHGKAELKTPDDLCAELLRLGLVSVDAISGLAYSQRFDPPRLLGSPNVKGYQVATLRLGAFRRQVKLHRLVWIAARGPIPAGVVPDHANRTKSDNRISNLRLVTHQQNALNRRSYRGEGNPAAKVTRGIAESIRRQYQSIRSYRRIARRNGVSASLVAQIIRGEAWV